MRLSVPIPTGPRGAGLGNEIIAWGKALIGAEELGLRALHPPWGLNRRRYWADFGTSRFDWVLHRSLLALPSITIGEFADDDYADAMSRRREEVEGRRGPLIVRHASGMSGGYLGIRRARPALLANLMSPAHVAHNLYAIGRRLDPDRLTVALHLRAGDFDASAAPRPGEFNKRIPFDWYRSVAASLVDKFPGRVQFLVFTDGTDAEVAKHLGGIPLVPLPQRSLPLLSDLLAMAQADLLVCSVSSFAMCAGFLSDNPYVWYGPHLGECEGWRSIWGHETQQQNGGTTARNAARALPDTALIVRGNAVGTDGVLPDALLWTLERALAMKQLRHDLLMYGVVPDAQTPS